MSAAGDFIVTWIHMDGNVPPGDIDRLLSSPKLPTSMPFHTRPEARAFICGMSTSPDAVAYKVLLRRESNHALYDTDDDDSPTNRLADEAARRRCVGVAADYYEFRRRLDALFAGDKTIEN